MPDFKVGAGGQTRTGTPVKAADFEALEDQLTPAHCIDYKGILALIMLVLAR